MAEQPDYSGVCVGGEDDGRVTSCSAPFWAHMARDRKTYIRYTWITELEVWKPEGQTLEETIAIMRTGYMIYRTDNLSTLETYIHERLNVMLRIWPNATIKSIVDRTGLTNHRVARQRRDLQKVGLL